MSKSVEISEERKAQIAAIRTGVTGMYSRHAWPGTRRTDEEMGWRLRVLGLRPQDCTERTVLELACAM